MVVKYVREDFRDTASGGRSRMGNPFEKPKMSLKQRLLYIYIGLGTASIFLLVYHVMGVPRTLAWGRTTASPGIVVDKIIENEGTPDVLRLLTVSVIVKVEQTDEDQFIGQVPTDEYSWSLVEQGSPITVEYQLNKALKQIRIVGITLRER